MVIVTVQDTHISAGQELTVCGKVKNPCARLTINIGHDIENLGLHFDCRFNHLGDQRTIVFNSRKSGYWSEELRNKNFPFQLGEEFKVTINFNSEQFFIKLPNGTVISFPNRHHHETFSYINVEHDVELQSFKIE